MYKPALAANCSGVKLGLANRDAHFGEFHSQSAT